MALLNFADAPHGGSHKLLPEWDSQPRITPTTIIDHSIVGTALGAWNYFRYHTGIESHFIIAGRWGSVSDGHIYQLMDTGRQADANLNANSFGISIETEDDGTPDDTPWTARQLASLKWLHNKLATIHSKIPRKKVTSCNGGGLGYHSLCGTTSSNPWTPSAGKTCPGRPARVAQFDSILVPAFVSGEEDDDMPPYPEWTDDQKQELMDDLWKMLSRGEKVDGTKPAHIVDGSIGKVREMQDLFGWGDGPDEDLSTDTHGSINVRAANDRLKDVKNAINDLVRRLEEGGVIAPPIP
jgi:hypothetical protein